MRRKLDWTSPAERATHLTGWQDRTFRSGSIQGRSSTHISRLKSLLLLAKEWRSSAPFWSRIRAQRRSRSLDERQILAAVSAAEFACTVWNIGRLELRREHSAQKEPCAAIGAGLLVQRDACAARPGIKAAPSGTFAEEAAMVPPTGSARPPRHR